MFVWITRVVRHYLEITWDEMCFESSRAWRSFSHLETSYLIWTLLTWIIDGSGGIIRGVLEYHSTLNVCKPIPVGEGANEINLPPLPTDDNHDDLE